MPIRPRQLLTAAVLAALPLGVVPAHAAPPAAPTVPLSDCVSADNGDPSVTTATVSPSAVSTRSGPRSVDLTVSAADSGGPGAASGVAAVSAQLSSPGRQTVPEDAVAMTLGSDGAWHARLVVPRGVTPGVYQPYVVVSDDAGNGVAYGAGTDRALPGTDVTVTSKQDSTRPRLTRLHLRHGRVDTRRAPARVRVVARATDGNAGVSRILVTAGHGRRSAQAMLHLARGTARDGTWRGRLVVPRFLGRNVTWKVTGVAVVDTVVNVRTYTPRRLARLDRSHHVDRIFRVRSTGDSAAPSATGLTVSPGSVDVRAADVPATLRVRAADGSSPVTAVRVRLLDPGSADDWIDTELRRVSGAPRDGWWEATVTMPRCSIAGTWTSQVRVTDSAERTRQVLSGLPTLEVVAGDHVVPRVVRTFDGAGRVVLDFSEDVTGISAASAPVRALSDGSDVAGAWTCADSAGAPVACATGALRRATFTPHPTVAPLGQLVVELNPEHSLGVTDLAGNPAGRRYTL